MSQKPVIPVTLIWQTIIVTLTIFSAPMALARDWDCAADLSATLAGFIDYTVDGGYLYDIRANVTHGAGKSIAKRLGADNEAVRGSIDVMLGLARHEHGPLSATSANDHIKIDLDLPTGLPANAHLKRTHEVFPAEGSMQVHRFEVDIQGPIIHIVNAHARAVQRGADYLVGDFMSHDIALKIDLSSDQAVIESNMGRLKIFVGDQKVADAVQLLSISQMLLQHFYPHAPSYTLKTYRGETLELAH